MLQAFFYIQKNSIQRKKKLHRRWDIKMQNSSLKETFNTPRKLKKTKQTKSSAGDQAVETQTRAQPKANFLTSRALSVLQSGSLTHSLCQIPLMISSEKQGLSCPLITTITLSYKTRLSHCLAKTSPINRAQSIFHYVQSEKCGNKKL